MIVTIPKIKNGMFSGEIIRVKISNNCPVCGKKRGVNRWFGRVHFYKKSFIIDRWDNECSHTEKYSELLAEAIEIKRGRFYHNQKSANNYIKQELLKKEKERQDTEAKLLEERLRIEKQNEIIEQNLLKEYDSYISESRARIKRKISGNRGVAHVIPKGFDFRVSKSKAVACLDITDECSEVNGLFSRNYIYHESIIRAFLKLDFDVYQE